MKNDTRQVKITNNSFDIRSHSIWRVLKQDIRFRFMPLGNFGGGPNLFYIGRLLMLHTAGRLGISLYVKSGLVRRLVNRLGKYWQK